MERFSIYNKSDKFYWSNNRIIYPIILICLTILLINNKGSIIEKNSLNNILLSIMFFAFVGGMILRLIAIPKTKPLQGNIDGFLTFDMNSIQIDNEVYSLEMIKNIKISNDDYYGKLIASTKGNLNSPRSNGVDNYLKIKLYSGEIKMCNYELYNSTDLQKIRRELINYYLNGKIEFENLANVLGEKNQKEIKELKLEIEAISTITNSHYNGFGH
ncbi:hypothetical protein C8P67_10210 [Flavobacterium aquicola]|uniref:Uncharacterized protein n=1 Tax=Flavobacterium aquicola TaxID=1682742 RepID=A0A3E0ERM7_9FLAO|nr:hypothetical protein C8P67_10210 [Flavobacterium aquicola]